MSRLRFTNDEIEKVSHLVRYHYIRYEPSWNNTAIRRWLRKVGTDNVNDLIDLAKADIKGKGNALVPLETSVLDEFKGRIDNLGPVVTSTNMLAINGDNVMALLGIPPGPKVGLILKDLLEAVTENPELNTVEDLTALVSLKKNPSEPN
jgi:hypothetical protein